MSSCWPVFRLGLLLSLVAGCTVVVPSVRITTVTPVVRPGAAQSFEPFPTDAPSMPASDPSPFIRTFRGGGPAARLGPLALKRGRFSVHVRFTASVFDSQFHMDLEDREGRFLASLQNQTGSFEETLSPSIESTDSYFLTVPQADGNWTIDVDPNG